MSIEKLIEFSKTGAKNTDDLNLEAGFPAKLQPARQWMNWLFNSLTRKINEIIDNSSDIDEKKINYDDVVDALNSVEKEMPLSANMGRELNEKKLNKEDLAFGSAPVFAARAWANFKGSTGEIRKSGNISSVIRNGIGNYTVKFTKPMEHENYAVISGVSYADAGTTFGIISQTNEGFSLQATFGGDNTTGSFDPFLATFAVFC